MKASKEEGGTRYSPGDKTVPGCQSSKVNLVTGSKKSSGAGEKWDWRKISGLQVPRLQVQGFWLCGAGSALRALWRMDRQLIYTIVHPGSHVSIIISY